MVSTLATQTGYGAYQHMHRYLILLADVEVPPVGHKRYHQQSAVQNQTPASKARSAQHHDINDTLSC